MSLEREDFQTVADLVYNVSSKAIAEGAELTPVILLAELAADHTIHHVQPVSVGPYFRNSHTKDVLGMMLNKIAATAPPRAIVALVSEAWMVELTTDQARTEARAPSAHPDRVEIVVVSLRSRDFNTHVQYRIERKGAKPELIYTPIDWKMREGAGRFSAPAHTEH